MKRLVSFLLTGLLVMTGVGLSGCSANSNTDTQENSSPAADYSKEKISIEYWQYFYQSKVTLIDKVIKDFEAKNPNITVTTKNFPYDSYQQKITAAVSANQSPDIINLYYGWIPKYVQSGVLQQLPASAFPTETIEKDYPSFITVNKIDGKYYSIPTAVRTMGLFWNKDIFKANGLDPNTPPKTLDDLLADAQKCTKRDASGKLLTEGITFQPTGQLHAWLRPILFTEFGQKPISDDNKKIQWNASDNGYAAFKWLTDLSTKYKVGEENFYTDDPTAFETGHAAMTIDGSYRLSDVNTKAPNLNYGVTICPSYNNTQTSFATFWTNAITKDVKGAKLWACTKFLQYLTSDEVMKEWAQKVGEVPAKVSTCKDPDLLKNEKLAPFIQQVPSATSYFYVDEAADRTALCNAIDAVVLKGEDPKKALDEATTTAQKVLDDYWSEN